MKHILSHSVRVYKLLMQLYPRKYRDEFGEEMVTVFSDLLHDAKTKEGNKGILKLWARLSIDIASSLMREHRENKKNQQLSHRLRLWAIIIALVLLIPLVLTLLRSSLPNVGWNWSRSDVIFAFVVLFGAAAVYELVAIQRSNKAYKSAVGLWVMTSLALVWINGAVGIIGDSAWPNVLYLSVLAVGAIGAFHCRLHPLGMAKTVYLMAGVQMLIPLLALIVAPTHMMEAPGVGGVFLLNAGFATGYGISGLLFRHSKGA